MELDEKGFVFIVNNRPYWCRMYGGNPWFMYWHDGQKSWVTLRRVNQTEIWMANENAISEDLAQIYHDMHKEFIGRLTP